MYRCGRPSAVSQKAVTRYIEGYGAVVAQADAAVAAVINANYPTIVKAARNLPAEAIKKTPLSGVITPGCRTSLCKIRQVP
ncbi:hypothetical protein [Sporomusa carbonis]|uniref:hypothetical protein n=1 Tax=Sporomusa carbonis TaxID=3076075 RepID=UPI003C7BA986